MTDILNYEETEIDGHLYPEPLLKAMLDSVQVANQVNRASWSVVRIQSGTLVMFVEKTNVMAIRQSGGDLTFLGELNEERFNLLTGYKIHQPNKNISRLFINQLSTHDFLDVLSKVRNEHHAFIHKQASAVRTRTHRANEHNQKLVDEIASAFDTVPLVPEYVQTNAEQPDSGLTPVDTLDSISSASEINDYPEPLLGAIAFSIKSAHQANPKAWALAADGQNLILLVGNTASTVVGPNGGGFLASGTVDADVADSLQPDDIYTSYPFEAFYLRHLDKELYATLFTQLSDQHVEAVGILAATVKTRGHHHHRHRQDIVEQIAALLGEDLPAPGYYEERLVVPEGYWRYSVDRSTWNDEDAEGYLSSQKWPNPSADLSDYPADQARFTDRIESLPGTGPESARRLWNIAKQMSVGDQIIAHQGTKFLAEGTAIGGYEYHPHESHSKHRRQINWTPLEADTSFPNSPAATRAKSGWGTVALTKEDYLALTGSALDPESPLVPLDIPAAILATFMSKGLTYSHAQIATFYTALQTKGFVVLSGISGTGKSKIAQHFVGMLPLPSSYSTTAGVDPDSVISLRVQPYMRRHRRIIIPVRGLDLLPERTSDDPGTPIPIKISLDGLSGSGSLAFHTPSQGNKDRVIYFHREIGDEFQKLKIDQPLTLVPVYSREDASRLDAIDMYTDASRIPADGLDTAVPVKRDNNLFLAVRPDWRDSTSLLGYYNPLTQTYEWTDFLRFILQAAESYKAKDGLAWFVILDDMNLAHVEYYFADLLSIIESGRKTDGFSHDPIRLTFPDTLADNAPPREVYLPPNLYIIGTVNMDETTHAFSPKVLDRAFTIELTEVDFRDYPPTAPQSETTMSEQEKRQMLEAFTRGGTFAQVSKTDVASAVDTHPQIRTWLSSLNTRLEQDRFHFGYRVFDEIAQFIFNADENEMFDSWEIAFDHAVFMKVLPKFNGSRARLLGPLRTLAGWAVNPDEPNPDILTGVLQGQQDTSNAGPDNLVSSARFPRVTKRAIQMLNALEEDGFVSFG